MINNHKNAVDTYFSSKYTNFSWAGDVERNVTAVSHQHPITSTWHFPEIFGIGPAALVFVFLIVVV